MSFRSHPAECARDALLEKRVTLDGNNVPYLYGIDCDELVVDALLSAAGTANSVLFVLDSKVRDQAAPLLARLRERVAVHSLTINAGEASKRISLVEQILESAIGAGLTRNSVVVGMGGGMVGNVAGLCAALLYRGTRLIHLPTTPIAAFDAVVSVKQAVNLRGGKNLCGTYYPPSLIACDLRWLASVPDGELLTGLAEMAKNVLAVRPDYEDALVRALQTLPQHKTQALLHLLDIGVDAKAPLLQADPRERCEALIFEYGHTAGHALEFTSRGALGHGEAVAWGMLVAAEVSHGLGLLSVDAVAKHQQLVGLLGLPDARTRLGGLTAQRLRATLGTDTKRGYVKCGRDEVAMVLLESLGRPVVSTGNYPLVPIPVDMVLSALDKVIAR